MRTITSTITFASLALSVFGTHAFSEECSSLARSNKAECEEAQNPEACQRFENLFIFSQQAESPREQKAERSDCRSDRVEFVPAPKYPKPIPVPKNIRDHISTKLKSTFENAQIEPIADEDHILYVSCEVEDVSLSIAMRIYQGLAGLFIETRLSARIKNDEVVMWVPMEVIDNSGRTIRFPGTNIENAEEIVANFKGEACVFPSSSIVVDALCSVYDTDKGKFDIENKQPSSVTLVGHSLGGSAVQYIAHSSPTSVSANDFTQCSSVNAFAFGSPGLDKRPNGSDTLRGNLKTYVSDCDWLAQKKIFRDKIQTGRITITSSSVNHSIDGIQRDICTCIQGNGNYRESKQFNDARKNRTICPNSHPNSAIELQIQGDSP